MTPPRKVFFQHWPLNNYFNWCTTNRKDKDDLEYISVEWLEKMLNGLKTDNPILMISIAESELIEEIKAQIKEE